MKINKNKNGKKSTRRQMGKRILAIALNAVCLLPILAVCVFATDGTANPIAPFNAFVEFVKAVVTCVGVVILLFGVVQFGASFQSHDPSQRTQGVFTFVGGLMIAFAPMILTYIGVNI